MINININFKTVLIVTFIYLLLAHYRWIDPTQFLEQPLQQSSTITHSSPDFIFNLTLHNQQIIFNVDGGQQSMKN